jgi:hypothetical protein
MHPLSGWPSCMVSILLRSITAARVRFRSPSRNTFRRCQLWLPALQSLGIPTNDHSLAGNNIDVSQQPSDIDPTNTTRSYSTAAYLFPNSARKNLAVLTSAHVQNIIWSPNKHRGKVVAIGVAFTSGGKDYTVKVKK